MANKKNEKTSTNYKKLKLLFTVVNKSKAVFYVDFLEQFNVNIQLVVNGRGTVDSKTLKLLGLEAEKSLIVSVIQEDKVKEILSRLEEKFNTVRNGKGIAYTISLKSIIGVSMYQFLCNERMGVNK